MTAESRAAMDPIDDLNDTLPDGWANCLEEPDDLPLDEIPSWVEK